MSNGRRFELRRKLGEGSFGEVFLADMVSLGGFRMRVALKVLNHRWGPDSDPGRRLRDEARLLGRLEHKNIVRVYDLVRIDGRWAVVMEALRGIDLERLQREGSVARLPARAALELVSAVAGALQAALHEPLDGQAPLRVVHRDIKPSNLILTADGVVKVLDFGIARAELEEREASTSSVGFGSLPYMSPERLIGDEATPAGDVYSLGALLYELLAGLPFGRTPVDAGAAALHRDKALEKLAAALTVEPVRPEQVHEELLRMIAGMLAYDPVDRPEVAQVRDRAAALATRVSGEGLSELAAREVPPILAIGSGEATTGILSEETRDSAPPLARAVGSNPTLISADLAAADLAAADLAGAPPEPADLGAPSDAPRSTWGGTTPPPPRRSPLPVLLGLALAILVLGLGWLGFGDRGTEEAPPTRPVVQAAAPPSPAEASPPVASPPPADPIPAPAEPIPAPADPVAVLLPSVPAAPPPSPPASRSAPARATTASAPPEAAPPASTEAPPEAAAPPAATVRQVKLVASGATAVRARCGARSGSGSSSLVVRDAPVGPCEVEVELDGARAVTSIQVTDPVVFQCAMEQGVLSCR